MDAHGRLLVAVCAIFLVILRASTTRAEFVLTIVHTNDVHARFEEFSKFGSDCHDQDADSGRCYGGVARRVTAMRELRERYPNLLLLDAGDQFQGTLWFYMHKGKAASHFMNLLKYDAMALGNHEFDADIEGLRDFLSNSTFPVLSANMDSSSEPTVTGLYSAYTLLDVNGEKVAVIGYTTKDTPFLSHPGKLVFEDEVESIREVTERLRSNGINKIVALGHAGFAVDKVIAREVEGVDLVIGGHTNTFLYTGVPPAHEDPLGDYPTVIAQRSGGRALVVQDFAFGKYLGVLHVTFDDDGKVVSWEGNPWLMDKTVDQDNSTLSEMARWKEPLERLFSEQVGTSHVLLDGQRASCRLAECNLGNFVTDAMVYWHIKLPDEMYWSDVVLAIHNGGGIRTSIAKGAITLKEVYNVHPFANTIDLVEMQGRHLWDVFEYSVWDYDVTAQHGRFLQVSGFRVQYNISQPNGRRVVKLEARCSKCEIPRYEPIRDDDVYKLAAPSFLVAGGDGFQMFPKHMLKHHVYGDLDVDILLNYVEARSPIIAGLEDRITLVDPLSQTMQCPYMARGASPGPPRPWLTIFPILYCLAACIGTSLIVL